MPQFVLFTQAAPHTAPGQSHMARSRSVLSATGAKPDISKRCVGLQFICDSPAYRSVASAGRGSSPAAPTNLARSLNVKTSVWARLVVLFLVLKV